MKDKTILLVDDERVIVETLAADLKGAGFSVLKAESGEKAVAMLQERNVDLAVIDLVMPGIGGIEVLQEVKERCPPGRDDHPDRSWRSAIGYRGASSRGR